MKKILIVQRSLQPVGGGLAVALWMIEALKREYEVSVLTWKLVDIDPINRFYGTSLSASDFNLCQVPLFLRILMKLIPDPYAFQQLFLLVRLCKKIQADYDIVIMANNEADLGCRAIQYIHYPHLCGSYRKFKVSDVQHWYHRFWHLINTRYRPWRLISGHSFDRMKKNLTLVNSDWTGGKTRSCYGIETTTVYPPVPGIFPQVLWTDRESGFVCIGRFSPEKRIDWIVNIIKAVRSQGYDVHLHIIGTCDRGPGKRKYYQQVKQWVQKNVSWIFLHENLSRQELVDLVSRHRYGIHGMADEHFGIAVAEMVRSGCITFVPTDGGQMEIVGGEERLLYETVEEAVAKIVRVISNPDEQISLCHHLKTRGKLFSTEQFMQRIQKVVQQF